MIRLLDSRLCLALLLLALSAYNRAEGVEVSGAIPKDTVWKRGSVIVVKADAIVPTGAMLTIEPGVVVKFRAGESGEGGARLVVEGRLNSLGTPAEPVVFTSERDDTVGGDSNGDGDASKPLPGDWGCVKIVGAGSTLQGCSFRYAGGKDVGGGEHSALFISGSTAPVDVTACDFTDSAGAGLLYRQGVHHLAPRIIANSATRCAAGIVVEGIGLTRAEIMRNNISECGIGIVICGADPSIEENRLTGNLGHPLKLVDGASPRCRWNDVRNNGLQSVLISGVIDEVEIWGPMQSLGIPFLLAPDLELRGGSHVSIRPGTVIKIPCRKPGEEPRNLFFRGALKACGTWEEPIIFTSERDDTCGGDSNGDGLASAPDWGDWGTLVTSQVTDIIEHCVFRYGKYSANNFDGVDRNRILWIQGGGEHVDPINCEFYPR